METKIVPYNPPYCKGPFFRVYAKKVILRVCKMTFWRWSLVANCYYYNEAKSIANAIEMIEVK